MPDLREVFQMSTQKVRPDRGFAERQEFRQRRRTRNRKIAAYAIVAVIIAIAVVAVAEVRNTSSVPAVPPTPTGDLGIFAPVAGRIVFTDPRLWVVDRVKKGVWAFDTNGPSDPTEGANVASTLVHLELDLEDALPPGDSGDGVEPLGWSSDGTELLVTRWKGLVGTYYVVHADGTETRLPNQSPGVGAATAAISPDGSRVVFASEGLTVVNLDGGWAAFAYPRGGEPNGRSMTFSSDGTQIAYTANDGVWLVNADGTGAHEILADEPALRLRGGADRITWSPAGDRLAVGIDGAIYTFAPDGSDFTKVITDGSSPFWSPDGSQIAYNGPSGLAIADANGSHIQAFGFAHSGPWHPGES